MESVTSYFLARAAIIVVSLTVMEAIATISHRYIMHGFGWRWHKSHHTSRPSGIEKNDLYALVFAVIAIALFVAGLRWWPLWWIAIGVTLYGLIYFMVHDVLVHRRWPFRHVPRKGYLKRIYQAHRLHHAVTTKENCVSFAFVMVKPVDKLLRELKTNRQASLKADSPKRERPQHKNHHR
ncbi:sterol desaturase family protein [Carnimonas bestiolae]|uniref:sterol desaturase family protein n=1 Tax=Carnimonas bestiolae TaxID=3402172 RepID=UPI003EDC59BF